MSSLTLDIIPCFKLLCLKVGIAWPFVLEGIYLQKSCLILIFSCEIKELVFSIQSLISVICLLTIAYMSIDGCSYIAASSKFYWSYKYWSSSFLMSTNYIIWESNSSMSSKYSFWWLTVNIFWSPSSLQKLC